MARRHRHAQRRDGLRRTSPSRCAGRYLCSASDVSERTASLWGKGDLFDDRRTTRRDLDAPSVVPTRSQGLSVLNSIATAHCNTALMRWRTGRAVSALACQMGVRISSTSPLVTSETGRSPKRGKTYRFRLAGQSCACYGLRQPGRSATGPGCRRGSRRTGGRRGCAPGRATGGRTPAASVLPFKFDAEFLAVQDRGDAIDSSPGCGPNCVRCLRDGTLAFLGCFRLAAVRSVARAA